MADRIRWGIRGAGNIARKFAEGLQALPDVELLAIGSRSQESADRFGDEFGIPRRYADYRAMAEDGDIDAVYVGTPHPMHKDDTILYLKAGKAVLCEKPFAVNRPQAAEMVRVAREEGVFLMEAMWTRFLPSVVQTRKWLAEEIIGEPRMVQADFGFRAGFDEESRLFDPEYAGGGLLDVGVYCVSFASMVFGGPPIRIAGLANLGNTGVDEQSCAVLEYEGGALAAVSSAVRTTTAQEARIMGTEGMIHLHSNFWCGTDVTLSIQGQEPQHFVFPLVGNGYNYEADAVALALRDGRLESRIMPLDESLTIMETMDRLRAQWGLSYPME